MPRGEGFSRSRTGCLQCRRKHEKCDEKHPTCSLCSQRGLDCQWPSTLKWVGKAQPTVSRHRSRRRDEDIDSTGLYNLMPAPLGNGIFDSDDEKRAWEYYVRLVSSNVPALDGPDNPYRHVSFTALSTPILRETIVCIATEHMLNFGLGSVSTAAQRQQRMLRTIGQNLQLITSPGACATEPNSVASNKLDREALLTAVVLQGVVVVQSEDGVLEPHVRCASSLMDTLGRFQIVPHSAIARMTVQRYAMVDLMLAFSRQRRPYAPRDFILHSPDEERWDHSEPSFHKMTGCPQPLMCFLVRIAHLACDVQESLSHTPANDILAQAYSLESELRAWGTRYTSGKSDLVRDALDILTECFYWTAHLLLARRVFRDHTRSPRVQHLAHTCFGLMGQLATGCGPDSSLPQPFYLAAREAVSTEDRAWVREKHEAMTAFYREQQRNLAMRLTERVWDITDQAETDGSNGSLAVDAADRCITRLDRESWFFIF